MDKTIDILNALANEKGLKFDDVVEAFKVALLRTTQKMLGDVNIKIDFDKENKKIFREGTFLASYSMFIALCGKKSTDVDKPVYNI